MRWIHQPNMRDAIRAIPDGKTRDVGFSTPDIYGRASQLYLALRKAQGNTQMPDTPEVRLWRGLLTLLALRHQQDLPLKWQAVTLTPGDTISRALTNPSFNPDDLLFDQRNARARHYLWNGRNFYVLTWAPDNAPAQDIAIYSPLTLLYPVADWQDVFCPPDFPSQDDDNEDRVQPIADFNAFLQRFFNKETRTFNNYMALQADERAFVSEWLDRMIQTLQQNGQTSGALSAIHNLSQYQMDLNVNPGDRSGLGWKPFHDGVGIFEDVMPEPLWSAPRLAYGRIFADQVCYFKVSASEGNPFSATGCQYSANYEIRNTPGEREHWYAFLPIHPDCREKCIQDKLAESVRMRYHFDRDTNQEAIEVSMTPPGAPTQTRLYPIEPNLTAMHGRACWYEVKGDDENPALLGMSSWPLIAVWPATIGQGWKEYYVARSDSVLSCLRIYGEADTGWTSQNGEAPPVESGHNALAVKTTYVPDAIPFVRMIPGKNDTKTPVSVGVVTPAMQAASQAAPITAEVAVDFGTSSSRVFYKLAGDTSPNACKELFVQLDEPLEVTVYKRKSGNSDEEALDTNKAALLSKEFISPSGKRTPDTAQTPLFSMFRRSADVPLNEVPPILEGVIYQPNKKDDPETMEHLITDLKWNGQNGIYYVPFMQQLCLHVMAYLYKHHHVNNINWHYALPKAMNPSLVDGMNSIWGTRIKDFLMQASGTNITQEILHPMTESVAASLYFNKYQQGYVQAHQGYLVVDIGGGSTDVALWQSKGLGLPPTLRWHSSVQVAGRDMFTARLESKVNSGKSRIDSLAEGIKNKDLQKLLEKMKKSKLNDTTAYVDRLLSTYSREIHAAYRALYQRVEGAWTRKMRGEILRSISLLMFALGYQVGLEIDSGCIEEPKAPGFFAICIGGRGSNVLDWLMLNQDYPELHDLFKAGVAASRKDDKKWPDVKIRILKSPDPKCEVAKGLLAQDGNVDGGWTFQSSQEAMDDPNYCPEAAERFLEAFNWAFPEQSAADAQSSGLMNSEGKVDKDLLTGYISRRIGLMARKDDAFRVLMESIHGMLDTEGK